MDGKTYEDQVIKITDLVGDDGILMASLSSDARSRAQPPFGSEALHSVNATLVDPALTPFFGKYRAAELPSWE